ncbi:MAG: Kazal-type serine protease inhibitor domain-containing protein [Myxococcales bacterium]|nr:Kazal-type serine protease inhibitor domain-containing protein [Myxococcales bacterium]
MTRTHRIVTCTALALALIGCEEDDVSLGTDALEAAGAAGSAAPPNDQAPQDGQSDPSNTPTGDGNGAPGNSQSGTDDPSTGGETMGSDEGSTDDGMTAPSDGEVQACGSRGLEPCPDGEFCNFPESASCGATDLPGTCHAIPDGCGAVYDPVCGCDGQTHGNECAAWAASVSVASAGECDGGDPGSGDMCGGFAGFACPQGEYCDYAAGDGCDISDGLGVCKTQPQACTREFNPVCGCNGQTYGNACEAAAAGASVRSQGECSPAGGGDCGGGSTCAANQSCQGATATTCGQNTGRCTDGSVACTLQYDPVCGCDGNEYGNACQARAAGAGILHTGQCN